MIRKPYQILAVGLILRSSSSWQFFETSYLITTDSLGYRHDSALISPATYTSLLYYLKTLYTFELVSFGPASVVFAYTKPKVKSERRLLPALLLCLIPSTSREARQPSWFLEPTTQPSWFLEPTTQLVVEISSPWGLTFEHLLSAWLKEAV